MRTIAIMQPTYMPWLGYFAMIDKVQCFVFLDDVQIVKRSWQVRNKIKQNDKELMLTIPILKEQNRDNMLINNTKYNEATDWKNKHLTSIRHSYSKSKYFCEVYNFIEQLYLFDYSSIGELNLNIVVEICRRIGINTKIVKSSNLNKSDGRKDELLSNICEALNAKIYLSAQGSAKYIEDETPGGEFIKRGINLFYQNYSHPIYSQLGNKFISHMGIYDLLFNEGFENALEIIRSGNLDDVHYEIFRRDFINLRSEN